MEKSQSELIRSVLVCLKDQGVLEGMVIIGSWCLVLYQDFFKGRTALPPIRTRDLDLLIPTPPRFKQTADLPSIFENMGFVLSRHGEAGYMVFNHPDLILEFLVPDRGQGSTEPYAIRSLGINAQALRFMDLLAKDTITLPYHGIDVRLPGPANFAFQKLLIAGRRRDKEKAAKDKEQAAAVLRAISNAGQTDTARRLYRSFPPGWRKTIKKELLGMGEGALVVSLGLDK